MAEVEATGKRKELIEEYTSTNLLEIFLCDVWERRHHRDLQPLRRRLGKNLGDNPAAGVIMDRFLHHAEIIKLDGKSYRMLDRREQLKQANNNPTLTQKGKWITFNYLPQSSF